MSKTIKEIVIRVTDKGSLKVTTRDVDSLNKAVDKTTKATSKASKSAREYDRNIKGTGGASSNASKNFSKMAQGMQGVLVPAYAEIAARVFALTAAYTALMRAADYRVLLDGQEAYAKLTGKSMKLVAQQIQKAAGGMLSFKEAAVSAALGVTSGLATEQMIKMTEVAKAASVALGRDMADSMDRLTRGIVKAEPEILDEIGIIIRLDTVYKNYAATLGTTTAKLSEYEKLQARANAITQQGIDKFGDIATSVDPNSFSLLAASVTDMVLAFSSFASKSFLEPIVKFLAQTKVLLALLLAVIAKSVLGKLGGIFKGFSKSLSDIPNKLRRVTVALNKFQAKQTQKRAGYAKTLEPDKLQKELMAKSLSDSIGDRLRKDSPLSKALIAGIKDPGFVKAVNRSLGLILRSARGSVKDGVITRGALKGQDEKIIDQLRRNQSQMNKANKEAMKGMKGLQSLQFLDWTATALQGITKLGKGMAMQGLTFMEYAKQVSHATSTVGMFSKTVNNQVQKGGLALVKEQFTASMANMNKKDGGILSDWKGLGKAGQNDMFMEEQIVSAIGRVFTAVSDGIKSGLSSTSLFLKRGLNFLGSKIKSFSSKAWEKLVPKNPHGKMTGAFKFLFKSVGKTVFKGFQRLGAVIKAGVGVAISAITTFMSSLQILSFAMGAFQLVTYAGSFMLDLDDSMSRAKDSANELTDALTELYIRAAEKSRKGTDIGHTIAASFTEAIRDQEFINNISTELSEALREAMNNIDLDTSGAWGGIQDFISDMFGSGLEDSLGKSLAAALRTQSELGRTSKAGDLMEMQGFKEFSEGTILVEGIVHAMTELQDTGKLTNKQWEDLGDTFEYLGVDNLTQALSYLNEEEKKLNKTQSDTLAQMKEFGTIIADLDSNLGEFIRSKVPHTPFKVLADDYAKLKKIMKGDMTVENKILKLYDSKLFSRLKDAPKKTNVSEKKSAYKADLESLKNYQSEVIKADRNFEKNNDKKRANIIAAEIQLKKSAIALNKAIGGINIKHFSEDFEKMEEDALKAALAIKKLNNKLSAFKEIGLKDHSSLISEQRISLLAREIVAVKEVIKANEDLAVGNKDKLNTEELKNLEHDKDVLINRKANLEATFAIGKLEQEAYKKNRAVTLEEKSRAVYAGDLDAETQKQYRATMIGIEVRRKAAEIIQKLNPLYREEVDISAMMFALKHKDSGNLKKEIAEYTARFTLVGRYITQLKALKKVHTEAFQVSKLKVGQAKEYFNKLANEEKTAALEVAHFVANLKKKQEADLRKEAEKNKYLPEKARNELIAERVKTNRYELHLAEQKFKLDRKSAKLFSAGKRLKVISNDVSRLKYEKNNLEMLPELLEERERIASIEREYGEDLWGTQLKIQKSKEKTLTLAKLEYALAVEQKDKIDRDAEWAGNTMSTITGGIESTLSSYFADQLMNRDTDVSVKDAIGETLAGAAGGLLSNIITQSVLGPKGVLAGWVASTFDKKSAEQIFGEDPDKLFNDLTKAITLAKDAAQQHSEANTQGLNSVVIAIQNIPSAGQSGQSGDPVAVPIDLSSFKDRIAKVFEDSKNLANNMTKEDFVNNSYASKGGLSDGKYYSLYKDLPVKSAEAIRKQVELAFPPNKYNSRAQNIDRGRKMKAFRVPLVEAELKRLVEIQSKAKALKLQNFKDGTSRAKLPTGQWNIFGGFDKAVKILDKLKVLGPAFLLPEWLLKIHSDPEGYFKDLDAKAFNPLDVLLGKTANASNLSTLGGSTDNPTDWVANKDPETKNTDYTPKDSWLWATKATEKVQEVLDSIKDFFSGENPLLEDKEPLSVLDSVINNGSLNVVEQEKEDLAKVIAGKNKTENTAPLVRKTGEVTEDLKVALKSNLLTQIKSDQFNTKALISNALAQVGTNLISDGLSAMLGIKSANGNVLRGGFQAFANGGIVKKPTMGLIGEGRYNEAVVPLPDGRSIPVTGASGDTNTSNNITVNVTIDSDGRATSNTAPSMNEDMAKNLGNMISQTVQQELLVQQRPGGLLSQF